MSLPYPYPVLFQPYKSPSAPDIPFSPLNSPCTPHTSLNRCIPCSILPSLSCSWHCVQPVALPLFPASSAIVFQQSLQPHAFPTSPAAYCRFAIPAFPIAPTLPSFATYTKLPAPCHLLLHSLPSPWHHSHPSPLCCCPCIPSIPSSSCTSLFLHSIHSLQPRYSLHSPQPLANGLP